MTSQTAHVDKLPEQISVAMSTNAKLVLFSLSTVRVTHLAIKHQLRIQFKYLERDRFTNRLMSHPSTPTECSTKIRAHAHVQPRGGNHENPAK